MLSVQDFGSGTRRFANWFVTFPNSQHRGGVMAKGKKCPSCGTHMFALKEDDQPKGRYVTYECRNNTCRFREKVFESYPR